MNNDEDEHINYSNQVDNEEYDNNNVNDDDAASH